MKPIQFEQVFELDTDLEEAWEVVSDTNALNRAIGLPAVQYTDITGPGSIAVRRAQAKFKGQTMIWEEHPFDWVKKQYFSIMRVYQKGPATRFWGGVQLAADEDESSIKIRVFAFFEARSTLSYPMVYMLARKTVKQTKAYILQQIRIRNSVVKVKDKHHGQTHANHKVLEKIIDNIMNSEAVNHEVLGHIDSHLRQAADDKVTSMRPYELADNWGLDRKEVLRGFLACTRHGATTMEWSLICPNCRVPKHSFASLREIPNTYHCDFCTVDYDANLDQSTELRFSVAPQVRQASQEIFCVGNPAAFPHVLSQIAVPPGEFRELVFTGLAHDYHLRAARSNHAVEMERDKTSNEHTMNLVYSENGFDRQEAKYPYPSTFTIHIENKSPAPVLFFLEDVRRTDQAATALDVTLFEDFRSQFSHEILSTGASLGIEHLTLMFTDLTESTALYRKIGDGDAYSIVAKHFEFLKETIQENNGQIVKTIGDAVMAAFTDPTDAVKASFDAQSGFKAFLVNQHFKENVDLKIGLHHGPVIAVSANNQIDFFGQTVNLAARTLAASKGSDIVLSTEMVQQSAVSLLLSSQELQPEEVLEDLKGFESPITLHRVTPRNTAVHLTEVPSIKLKINPEIKTA